MEAVPSDLFLSDSHPQKRATTHDSVRLSALWLIDLDDLTCIDTVIPVRWPKPSPRVQAGSGRVVRI